MNHNYFLEIYSYLFYKDKLIKLGLTDELAQKVVDNFGDVIDGIYVTKERFNEVNNELKSAKDTIKERDTQLEKLQNDNDSNEDLKKQIADLKKANADAAKEAENKLNAERKSNVETCGDNEAKKYGVGNRSRTDGLQSHNLAL